MKAKFIRINPDLIVDLVWIDHCELTVILNNDLGKLLSSMRFSKIHIFSSRHNYSTGDIFEEPLGSSNVSRKFISKENLIKPYSDCYIWNIKKDIFTIKSKSENNLLMIKMSM